MEVMFRVYRDPETGKIWKHAGGQDPIEIDESFAKIMFGDINSIPVLNSGKKKNVICPNCGNTVPETPFCSECGARLGNVICPNCGSVVKRTPFCPECGAKLDK